MLVMSSEDTMRSTTLTERSWPSIRDVTKACTPRSLGRREYGSSQTLGLHNPDWYLVKLISVYVMLATLPY